MDKEVHYKVPPDKGQCWRSGKGSFSKKKIRELRRHLKLRSYYCPSCGAYHVTHKEKNDVYRR